MSNTEDFKKLVDETAIEAERLLTGSQKNDLFLTEVARVLYDCKNNNYVVLNTQQEFFRLLGNAAVRQFDSFDYVPEAVDFVAYAVALSKCA